MEKDREVESAADKYMLEAAVNPAAWVDAAKGKLAVISATTLLFVRILLFPDLSLRSKEIVSSSLSEFPNPFLYNHHI